MHYVEIKGYGDFDIRITKGIYKSEKPLPPNVIARGMTEEEMGAKLKEHGYEKVGMDFEIVVTDDLVDGDRTKRVSSIELPYHLKYPQDDMQHAGEDDVM